MPGIVFSLPHAISHARKYTLALIAVMGQMPPDLRNREIPMPDGIDFPPSPDINQPECWIALMIGKCIDPDQLPAWRPPANITLQDIHAALRKLEEHLAGIQASLESY